MAAGQKCLDGQANPSVCKQGWRGEPCYSCQHFSFKGVYLLPMMLHFSSLYEEAVYFFENTCYKPLDSMNNRRWYKTNKHGKSHHLAVLTAVLSALIIFFIFATALTVGQVESFVDMIF